MGDDPLYHIHEDKRVAQSVEQICLALNQLIEEMPYTAISVTGLAARAGVSKATFYRSFDALEDVLALEVDEAVKDMIAYIMKARVDDDHPGEMRFFQAFFRFWMTHSSVVDLLIRSKTTYLLIDAFSAALYRHLDFFRQTIDIDDEWVKYYIAVRAAALTAVLVCWLGDEKRTHPDKMPALLLHVMGPAGHPSHRPAPPDRHTPSR